MTRHYWSDYAGQDIKDFRDSLQQEQQRQESEISRLKQEAENKQKEAVEKTFNAAEKQKEASGNPEAAKQAEQARQEANSAKAEAKEAQNKLYEAQEEARKTETLKKEVSQSIGENYGDKFCTEKLGYKEVLHGDSKTIKQGFDSVYYDPKTKETVVVEFKGQDSQLSSEQKKISWTPEVCDKVLAREGQYKGSSETEWQTAQQVKDAYNKGELRYEVVRTKVNNEGQLYTDLEKDKTMRPSEPKKMRQSSETWSKQENKSDTYKAMEQYLGVQKQTNTESQSQAKTETNTNTYSESKVG